ncbi:hypothetical protein [Streptomyces sp. SID12501]|uniref:Uncharacterized protein n=1 Tax=Streptomyces sp. SID12501 TaxID=2706042 RepID=A0A6B3BPH6_9ACTN|nr:hypothetical protein [Streptomyces sp. SID12501]NEC86239.1 hypothetical protein [Streptomyces sp. SID12501]
MDELLKKIASTITDEDITQAQESSVAMRETSGDAKKYRLQMFAADAS